MHLGQRVSGVFLSLTSLTWKRAALVGLLALALVGLAGVHSASAQVDPQPGVNCLGAGNPGPSMTVQIFNNSTDYTIFPLLSAGTRSPNDDMDGGVLQDPGQPISARSDSEHVLPEG
jgi:hypothetical protein